MLRRHWAIGLLSPSQRVIAIHAVGTFPTDGTTTTGDPIVLPTRLAGLTLLVGVTTALHPSASPSRLPTVEAPAGIACTQQQPLFHGGPKSGARITVTYDDADIRDVLAAFALFAGRTIKVSKAVHGSVTTQIRDQPWDVGLQSILVSQQLAASEDRNGIITVDNCTKK
jgi:hypothetical protein